MKWRYCFSVLDNGYGDRIVGVPDSRTKALLSLVPSEKTTPTTISWWKKLLGFLKSL